MSTCAECKHWRLARQGNAKRAGACHRNAPRPVEGGGPVVEAQWPITLEDDGCSEFAERAEVSAPSASRPTEPAVKAASGAVRTPRKTAKAGKSRKTR